MYWKVLCQINDVLMWGAMHKQHSERLRKAFTQLQEAGVTLNDKCKFSKSRMNFLGQVIEASGVSPDPDKMSAVEAKTEPSNVSEVRPQSGPVRGLQSF